MNSKKLIAVVAERYRKLRSCQADKRIELLIKSGNLLAALRASFETDDTLILNNSL
jgi:hypothetical protein